MSNKVRACVVVSGKVQGVFFRLETQRAAERHGVRGWVSNQEDRTVKAVFEGSETDVNRMIEWCHTGSPNSVVTYVDVNREPYTGRYVDFEVRY